MRQRDIGDGRIEQLHKGSDLSKFNSFWGTSRFRPPNVVWAVSSGFDQPSMTGSASSRIPDAWYWGRIADNPGHTVHAANPSWLMGEQQLNV